MKDWKARPATKFWRSYRKETLGDCSGSMVDLRRAGWRWGPARARPAPRVPAASGTTARGLRRPGLRRGLQRGSGPSQFPASTAGAGSPESPPQSQKPRSKRRRKKKRERKKAVAACSGLPLALLLMPTNCWTTRSSQLPVSFRLQPNPNLNAHHHSPAPVAGKR